MAGAVASIPFNVPAGQTGTLLLPARFGYASPFTSPLTGGGTLNVTVEYVRAYFSGDWSAFTGRINVSAPASGSGAYYNTGDFRINNSAGYANAAIYLNNGVNLYNINANGQTTDIGELGGGATAYIGAGGSTGPTWRIGAKNTTNTYAGVIADAGVTSLIKTGTGMLVFSGANTYSGGTTISGGTLMASNTTGSATGSGNVAVNAAGTLAGNGIVGGNISVNASGTFAPGPAAGFGILTASNTVTLAANSTTVISLRHSPLTNDSARILGTLTEGGTLNVVDTGGGGFTAGNSFKLFNAASYSGAFAGYSLPSLTGNLVWNTNTLKSSGTLTVVTLSSPTIANIHSSGANLVFSGTGGVNSWPFSVLSRTNLSAGSWVPAGSSQFDTSGNFTLTLTNAIVPVQPQTFYKLQLQ